MENWIITKTDKGIQINTRKPTDKSYIELSRSTPDSIIYGLGISFEELMKLAKEYVDSNVPSYLVGYKEVE